MSEKTLRILIVVFGLLFIYSSLMWSKNEYECKKQKMVIQNLNNNLDSLKKVSDSLYDENFPCQIELGRYQVAYEIFMERNPKGAEQYGTIISEETE